MKFANRLISLLMMASLFQVPTTVVAENARVVVDDTSVARFYQEIGYQPVWMGPHGLLPAGQIALQMMANAFEAGLAPDDYRVLDLETARIDGIDYADEMPTPVVAPYTQCDIILTHKILEYATHLSQGRIMPETIDAEWLAQRRVQTRDIPAELAQAVKKNRLKECIESLHPKTEAYRGLRKALQQYASIERSGGWSPVVPGPILAKGDRGPRVAALKQRLKLTADWSGNPSMADDTFDDMLASAVRHFQRRHGLKQDGLVGKQTLDELNIPVTERITQLELNMERWRWFPDSLGERYIIINIPAFELRVVEANTNIYRSRVIVGKKERPTPVMSDWMIYLEFNPFWNIPQEIARNDILPEVIKDPAYLNQRGIHVFDSWDGEAEEVDPATISWERLSARFFPFRLQQEPTDSNALGKIKFMFPNPHSIYIHDTPGKALFNRQVRTFSSGCVRVEKPMILARYLLGWSRTRLEAVIAQEQPKTVILDAPIPVHLVYFTAWVDEDETVHFRKDIYGRDERVLFALGNASPI